MNHIDFQNLAEERAGDAIMLLSAGRWSAAYYLAGYAVECALKACIAKKTNQGDFPDRDFAQKCYTHNIENLVGAAGLEPQRQQDRRANHELNNFWSTVKDWDEKARYQLWGEGEARELVSAVTDTANGVLRWIMGHW